MIKKKIKEKLDKKYVQNVQPHHTNKNNIPNKSPNKKQKTPKQKLEFDKSFMQEYQKRMKVETNKKDKRYDTVDRKSQKQCHLNLEKYDAKLCICKKCTCGKHQCNLHVNSHLSKSQIFQRYQTKKDKISNSLIQSLQKQKKNSYDLDSDFLNTNRRQFKEKKDNKFLKESNDQYMTIYQQDYHRHSLRPPPSQKKPDTYHVGIGRGWYGNSTYRASYRKWYQEVNEGELQNKLASQSLNKYKQEKKRPHSTPITQSRNSQKKYS